MDYGSIHKTWDQHGQRTAAQVRLVPVVAELVLESVHPGNFGDLPPEPFMIAVKAKQIGLIAKIDEAFELVTFWTRWQY